MEAVDPKHLYQLVAILVVVVIPASVALWRFFGKPRELPLKQPVTIRKYAQFATREELDAFRAQHDRDIDQLRRDFTEQLRQLNLNGEGRYERLGDRIDDSFNRLRSDFREDVGGLHEKINKTATAVAGLTADVENLQVTTRDIAKQLRHQS